MATYRVVNQERVATIVRYLQSQPLHDPSRNPSPYRALMLLRAAGGENTTYEEVFAAIYIHAQTLREIIFRDERELCSVPKHDPLPTSSGGSWKLSRRARTRTGPPHRPRKRPLEQLRLL